MIISEKGLELIKKFEGCKLQSYDDYNDNIVNSGDNVLGTLTIGYGHIENVFRGQVISQSQADELLRNDMIHYSNEVQEVINKGIISFEVNQNMFDALVSFNYNLGQGNLIKLCQGRDYKTIADKMLLYNNAGSVWEDGLTKRRQAERDLFLQPCETSLIKNVSHETILGNPEIARLQKELNIQGFRDMNGNKLIDDGFGGELTLSACPIVKRGSFGNITGWIQLRVGCNCDNDFGVETEKVVKEFQSNYKLQSDGIIGKQTWSKFFELMK